MRHLINRQILALGIVLGAAACGGSSSGPAPGAAVGSYTATSFTTTGASGQRNELVAGSTLLINLAADGTTTGHLHVAGTGGGAAIDADMAGTWTQNGSVVRFTQSADTFVRSMDFTWGPNANGVASLTGDNIFSGSRVQIIMTRAP